MLDSLIFNFPWIKYAPQTNSSNQDIAGEIWCLQRSESYTLHKSHELDIR